MKDNFTSITVVLDRSSSMSSLQSKTIEGFNSFLEDQKKEPGEAVLTLATFASDYTLVHDCVSLKEVPPLTTTTYHPNGCTALLDAIGKTMNATGVKLAAMKEEDRPSKVLFVIITDGEENSSREFRHEQVLQLIKHQQEKYSWSMVYLGANQDAIQVGSTYGISAGNSFTYAATAGGVKSSYSAISSNTRALRRDSRVGATADFFSLDKNTPADADKPDTTGTTPPETH